MTVQVPARNPNASSDPSRRPRTFRQGLAMMAAQRAGIDPELAGDAGDDVRLALSMLAHAANAGGGDRAKALNAARDELVRFDAIAHPRLARALAERLRALSSGSSVGDDNGEIVAPAWLHTPELLARFTAAQAAKGVDPRRIRRANPTANPATGAQEFFWPWDKVKSWFGAGSPAASSPASPSTRPPQINPIEISGRRSTERLGPPAGIERIAADPVPVFRPDLGQGRPDLNPTWRVAPPNPFYNQEVFDTFSGLLTQWEDLKKGASKYKAPEGKITGGYGHVFPNDTEANIGEQIPQAEIDRLLRDDYKTWADTAQRLVTRELTPVQSAAILSLMHNIGPTKFGNSKALKALNAGDDAQFEKEFREFRLYRDPTTKELVPSRGLEKRRNDEMNVFFGRPRRPNS
ncbi:MAG: glycoside hydrolase family protein [Rhodobacteraceae bacterium]|nr:glycoside hydrolase family protein [Paracoccaceae bacterium]